MRNQEKDDRATPDKLKPFIEALKKDGLRVGDLVETARLLERCGTGVNVPLAERY